ncbi:mechanosensitive ion channel protein MscS [Candidatus Woesearchaeota archaeon]|jgi:small-conductance mechanosensitive channel|nr:mechanosensitive ion channel protein MscS [Candidatus Woesearchaeota archaeon]|tara:strand:- start:25545 stop:26618 length:1074 start_codon:yes stop_codon:yes gene_type:complete
MGVITDYINKYLSAGILGSIGAEYLTFLGVFIASLIVLKIFKIYIISYLKKLARKSKTKLDDITISFIDKIKWKSYVVIAFIISSKTLTLHALVDKVLNYVLLITVVYLGVKFLGEIINHYTEKQIQRALKGNEDEDTTLISVLGRMAYAIVWILAFLLLLSNFGINITSLIAGLGIGGIAIAFALQSILQDLFSSFTIYFDKPFKKGDFIIIGSDMGVIKHIGIKSTRVQTLQGQELVVSNRELTSTRINNYKKMQKRRILFNFGVEYGTSTKKLKAINTIVRDVFKNIKLATLDRVHFKDFGDFSLNYEVVYYLNTNDYNKYMDTQEQINLGIKDRFEKQGIEMAFPTQTIHVKK